MPSPDDPLLERDGIAVFCADVGSTSAIGGFAWWSWPAQPADPRSLDALASAVCDQLEAGQRVALGLEAPLSLPFPAEGSKLFDARPFDGNRAAMAPAAAYTAMAGLLELLFVLRAVRAHPALGQVTPHVDVSAFETGRGPQLLLWEAFVSGPDAKEAAREAFAARHGHPPSDSDQHAADAALAVEAFVASRADAGWGGADRRRMPVLSLAAAAVAVSQLPLAEVWTPQPIVVKPGG